MRRFLLGFGAACFTVVFASRADAYDALAQPCAAEPYYCEIAPIVFDHTDALPVQFSFDTGWVPQGSDLQVHIWAGIFANTYVKLSGQLETSWPDALTIRAPGDKGGGSMSYHYGVELGAEGKIDISVAGQSFSWTGDLPYVPQIDFQVENQGKFDAWGWPPGMSLSDTSLPQTIAQIGISDIVGGSIPGIDGGFELDAALEFKATYVTNQLVVATTDGKVVAGGPITDKDGETSTPYLGGPSVELDVHPEGSVDYDGVLHVIPAFYVDLLGSSWSIPVADIPIPFPITSTSWKFDPQRVHVPLPDLVIPKAVIDFGEVEVGQKKLLPFSLFNAGEAALKATVVSGDPKQFHVWDPQLEIDAFVTGDSAVRFEPKKSGPSKALVYVATNDPSDPIQTFEVHGTGLGPPQITIVQDEGGAAEARDDGGCACRNAGTGGDSQGALAAAALGAMAIARRRRLARRASVPTRRRRV